MRRSNRMLRSATPAAQSAFAAVIVICVTTAGKAWDAVKARQRAKIRAGTCDAVPPIIPGIVDSLRQRYVCLRIRYNKPRQHPQSSGVLQKSGKDIISGSNVRVESHIRRMPPGRRGTCHRVFSKEVVWQHILRAR